MPRKALNAYDLDSLGSGTRDGTKFLRDDGTWQPGGGLPSGADNGEFLMWDSGAAVWAHPPVSPNPSVTVVGRFYDAPMSNTGATAPSTLAQAAGRMDIAPWTPPMDITFDRLGVSVSTAGAGSTCYACIYSSVPSTGWPNALLYNSGALAGTAVADPMATMSGTLNEGVIYWCGVLTLGGTPTLRATALAGMAIIAGTSGGTNGYATVLRKTGLSVPPSTWGFNSAELTAGVVGTIVRMRAA